MTLSGPASVARQYRSSETARVLRPDGRLYAATSGEGHMRRPGLMRQVLDPSHPPDAATKDPLGSSPANRAARLSPWFPEASPGWHPGAHLVTDRESLLGYFLPGDQYRRKVSEPAARLRRETDLHGTLRITRDPGHFVARR